MIVVPVVASPPIARADLPPVSLTYSILPGSYDNVVRVGNVTDMLYPRIVVDHGDASPYRGTIYVVGLAAVDTPCRPIVVARSTDGGRSFEAPRRTDPLCASGPSLSVDINRTGVIYAAGWGPVVARSSDRGVSWSSVAIENTSAPASLTVDPVTGAIYLAWSPLDSPWGDSPGPIRVSTSRDGGSNWSVPTDILRNGSLGSRPQVAAISDSVVVAFRDGPASTSVAAVASSDGARTWGNTTSVGPADPCDRLPTPSIAASPSGLFALSWTAETGALGCPAIWGNSTEAWAAVSSDGGRTFSPPVRAGGPPAWIGAGFGGAVAFDDTGQLFVAWRSIRPDWTGTVYVANSTDLGSFENASFTLRLREGGGNSTAQENLAPGPNGTMYLAWMFVDPSLGPTNPLTGIFVRSIAGEATGDVVAKTDLGATPLDVEIRNSATNESQARVPWTGTRFSIPELKAGSYDVWLHLGNGSSRAGAVPVQTWGVTSFTLEVGEGAVGPAFPWVIPVGIVAGLAVLGAVFAGTQYTRMTREEVLQRKVRLLMYEHVRENPGASFADVRGALGLKNGVAAYHLGVLEKQGLLHSESKRGHRWYYPNGDVSMWRDLPLSSLQSGIIAEVRRVPGIGIRELARATDRRASTISANVKALAREGALRADRVGRRLRCYPAESPGDA